MDDPIAYMRIALEEARAAYRAGEIPVGALIVHNGTVIAKAHNSNRAANNPLRHAEMLAIEQAAGILANERLTGCDLYVTKEPCAMCAGAIVHARIRTLYIGAEDIKYGACGSALSVCGNPLLNHRPEIRFGVLQEEAAQLLRDFFRERRGNPI